MKSQYTSLSTYKFSSEPNKMRHGDVTKTNLAMAGVRPPTV